MTGPVLAHAGQVGWDDYLLMACPLVFFAALIVVGRIRRRKAGGDAAADGAPPEDPSPDLRPPN